MMFLLSPAAPAIHNGNGILLYLASLHAVAGLVVVNPAVACVPAVVGGHVLAFILNC
jgi:hypothetical protein